METMISGRVLEQGVVVREARVVEGTWEYGIRPFLKHHRRLLSSI
jgi:hypothetical protein